MNWPSDPDIYVLIYLLGLPLAFCIALYKARYEISHQPNGNWYYNGYEGYSRNEYGAMSKEDYKKSVIRWFFATIFLWPLILFMYSWMLVGLIFFGIVGGFAIAAHNGTCWISKQVKEAGIGKAAGKLIDPNQD